MFMAKKIDFFSLSQFLLIFLFLNRFYSEVTIYFQTNLQLFSENFVFISVFLFYEFVYFFEFLNRFYYNFLTNIIAYKLFFY